MVNTDVLERLSAQLGPKGFSREDADLAPWLTDWRGRWTGRAAALLSPATTAEVARVVRICAAAGVPIVPQGGNTSMVGGSVPDESGSAVLLSLRRMQAIRSLTDEIAVCEAGVILANLHDAAGRLGRRFPLTLGARGSATIGGLLSTNAGGTQVLRFGTMRALVAGVEAVLPNGMVHDGLTPLPKDNRGYNLDQLLIGAEGTLGIVTAAALRLVPAIGSRAVAWIGLDHPQTALALLRMAEGMFGAGVESFELVPRSALELVLEHVPGSRAPLTGRHAWNVLMEITAPLGAPSPTIDALLEAAMGQGLLEDAVVAGSEAQAEAFWRLRDSISEGEKKDGPATKHDISVAVAAMPAFIEEASHAVEQRFPGTRVNAFGHLGDGNVHFNVRAPEGSGQAWVDAEGQDVSTFVHDLVTAAGGSISAEHGIGQMKREELGRLGTPARLFALCAIKAAFDPRNIMNPGKLVPLPGQGEDMLADLGGEP